MPPPCPLPPPAPVGRSQWGLSSAGRTVLAFDGLVQEHRTGTKLRLVGGTERLRPRLYQLVHRYRMDPEVSRECAMQGQEVPQTRLPLPAAARGSWV